VRVVGGCEPRPELPGNMEADLTAVASHLARNRWPFRRHATYDETIGRALDVYEAVDLLCTWFLHGLCSFRLIVKIPRNCNRKIPARIRAPGSCSSRAAGATPRGAERGLFRPQCAGAARKRG
jgi:hypothetical protein